jgi:cation transport ATPase
MQVMQQAEADRPPMRRIADRLSAWYTPLGVGLALAAWLVSGDPRRFLAVLVIATPCPLAAGDPVAILGAISGGGAARHRAEETVGAGASGSLPDGDFR